MENIYSPRSDSHLIEPDSQKPWRSGAEQHNALDNPHAASLGPHDCSDDPYCEPESFEERQIRIFGRIVF